MRNLVKRYGDVAAVDGVSFDVKKGELIALLGASGCGKTTTLRMIAGYVEATSGDIRLDGRDVTSVPARARNVGMVFQGYALFPHMSVFRNIAFGLEMRGVSRSEIDSRVRSALATVRMDSYGDRMPSQLSGGQQQRIALARAIVIRPSILLLDEPLSALDAKLREDVRGEITLLQRELGLTALMVTHDQEEALAMADRVVVMSEGAIQQIGTPREIYERPANRDVAAFVGRCNFIPGSVDDQGTFRPACEPSSGLPSALKRGNAVLAVRPENVRLSQADGLQAKVETATYLGTSILLLLRLIDGTVLQTSLPVGSQTIPALGETVCASWSPDNALFYPAR
ncbi:MAG: ABC transporter ATP-binding protein [Mesorhizobium sp.]